MSTQLERTQHIVDAILQDYTNGRTIDKLENFQLPDKSAVLDITEKLISIIFPGFFRDKSYHYYNPNTGIAAMIEEVIYNLTKQIAISLRYQAQYADLPQEELQIAAETLSDAFFEKIPEIRAKVNMDVEATLDGDPAALNYDEIIFSYPGLYAITINRLAHELYQLKIPLIPRMMTEHAHSLTGIDIHPGATLGKYFFIDHGTGIVVGETTVIGDNVKIYQGVTLGALSTRGGQKLKGSRRHPTIEDNVTIYAGASVLGGDTVIGAGSVIGSNAFITTSLAPGTRVSVRNQDLSIKNRHVPAEQHDVNDGAAWVNTANTEQ